MQRGGGEGAWNGAGPTSSPRSRGVAFAKPLAVAMDDEEASSCTARSSVRHSAPLPNQSQSQQHHHTIPVRGGDVPKAQSQILCPAMDAARLRRQVQALQLGLQQHLEGERYLQSINQQLRDRLELYMKNNHENVQRAEIELNNLHEDMEQTLELQRHLAQRSTLLEKQKKEVGQALKKTLQDFESERTLLQEEIERMSEDLCAQSFAKAKAEALQAELEFTCKANQILEQDLHLHKAEVETLKQEVAIYYTDISKLISKAQTKQSLEESGKKYLLLRFLQRFQEGARNHRSAGVREKAAMNFAKNRCCKHGLRYLRMASLRAKMIRLAQDRRAQACLKDCLRAWLLLNAVNKVHKKSLQKREKETLLQILKVWRNISNLGKISDDEELRLTNLAQKHYCSTLQRHAWRNWIQWVELYSKPHKIKLNYFRVHIDRLLCSQALSAWKCFVSLRKVRRSKMHFALHQERLLYENRAFLRWHKYSRDKREKGSQHMKSLQFRELHLQSSMLRFWLSYLQCKRHSRMSKKIAFSQYIHTLQRKVIVAWKCGVRQRKYEMRGLLEVNRALMKSAITFWRDYHALYSLKRQKWKKADVHCKRKERRMLKKMLILLLEKTQRKRQTWKLLHLYVSRRRYYLLRASLQCWRRYTVEHLLHENAKYQHDLVEAKEQYEDQKHQITSVNVQNLQLIDRLHSMSAEIAHLKVVLTEKEKQGEDLQHALEDHSMIEKSINTELVQRHLEIEELEIEISRLEKKFQAKCTEENVGRVQHTMEIEGRENAIRNIQAQIADKSAQVQSYEEFLRKTAERLEGTSEESEEQISNAFQIAGSLRKLLEDRENQYASLEGDCWRQELELGEVQRKLAAARNAYSDILHTRDSNIHQLETMLAQKQDEIRDTQYDLEKLQSTIGTRESHIRRLEYELKLKSEKEYRQTRMWVSSLGSWASASGQVNSITGFKKKVHSDELESLNHLNLNTKDTFKQGLKLDGCVSEYRWSSIKCSKSPLDWKGPEMVRNDTQCSDKVNKTVSRSSLVESGKYFEAGVQESFLMDGIEKQSIQRTNSSLL